MCTQDGPITGLTHCKGMPARGDMACIMCYSTRHRVVSYCFDGERHAASQSPAACHFELRLRDDGLLSNHLVSRLTVSSLGEQAAAYQYILGKFKLASSNVPHKKVETPPKVAKTSTDVSISNQHQFQSQFQRNLQALRNQQSVGLGLPHSGFTTRRLISLLMAHGIKSAS